MSKAYERIETPQYEGLVVDINTPTDVMAVKIRKETSKAAVLKRGTVLALSAGTAGDGEFVILGTDAKENETLTANCILAEDVEVGTAASAVALAYRTGHFAKDKLIVASGKSFTDKDKEALRDVGILISDAMTY